MKKIIIAVMALSLLCVGCKKKTAEPMSADQQRNAIKEAVDKFATYVDVPNWEEAYDQVGKVYESSIQFMDEEKVLKPLMDYLKEVDDEHTDIKEGVTITTVVLSNYNGDLVIKMEGGDFVGKFVESKVPGYGLKIGMTDADGVVWNVSLVPSKGDEIGKLTLGGEESKAEFFVPKFIDLKMVRNGKDFANLNIQTARANGEGQEINPLKDDLAALLTMNIANYSLATSVNVEHITNAVVGETLRCRGNMVEAVSVSLNGAKIPQEEGDVLKLGNGQLFINICDIVQVSGAADVDKVIEVAQEFPGEYETLEDAEAAAKKLNEALDLKLYYYNDFSLVQAKIELEPWVMNEKGQEGNSFTLMAVMAFADGSRNTIMEFATPEFQESIMERVEKTFENIMKKIFPEE